MSFHVGQKVVCVSTTHDLSGAGSSDGWPDHVIKGGIYTVREVDERTLPLFGVVGIRLHEALGQTRMTCIGSWETAFSATCFRPVVERKTDISVFTRMLTPTKERVS